MVILIRGWQKETPRFPKKEGNRIATTSNTSFPLLQLANKCPHHPLNSRQPTETLSKNKLEDTMLGLGCICLNSDKLGWPYAWSCRRSLLLRNFPRLPPMRWGDTLAKGTQSKKSIIGSQPRRNHNVFTHYRKDSNCEVWKKTNTARAKRGWDPHNVWTGLYLPQISETWSQQNKKSERGKRIEMRTLNALIVRYDLTNWIQRYPTTSGNFVVFAEIPSSVTEVRNKTHRQFRKTCQIMTSTPHRSETNTMAERTVRRERRNSHRSRAKRTTIRMADVKTAFEQRYAQKFDGPSIPNIPTTAKDMSGVHPFGKTTLKRIFFGCVPRAGGVDHETWWKQAVKICKNQKSEKYT